MKHGMVLEKMTTGDWDQVRDIYLEGITTGNATFQKTAPSWEEWDRGHHGDARIVACSEGKVAGWAALSPVSGRCVYSGVGEVSVYVRLTEHGRGIGSLLLASLIDISEQNGFWTLQSGIFPENTGSITLHKKHGFREVGRRERIGFMDGVWRDTILFERRSSKVGI